MTHTAFAALCANKAIHLFESGEPARAIPYLVVAVQASGEDEGDQIKASAIAELAKRRSASLVADDPGSTQLYDDLIRCFFTAEAHPMSLSEAAWRADRRRLDGLLAHAREDLEMAAAHLLAAAALAPGCSKTREASSLVARSLCGRIGNAQIQDLTVEQAVDLGIVVVTDDRIEDMLRLAEWLYWKTDFEAAMLFSQRACSKATYAGVSFRAEALSQASKYRLNGASGAEAEKRSAERALRTLLQYGPSSGLTDELLLVRAHFCITTEHLSLARADLSELLRRNTLGTENLKGVAQNTLLISRNALNWDFREAIKILEAHSSDMPLELMFLAWSGGEMDATLRLAKKVANAEPSFSILPILHAMATDLTLKPIETIGSASPGAHKIYASVCCWGDEHIRLMERAMLPSLSSPGNFPALAQSASIYLDLFTMPSEIERLGNSPHVQRLGKHCEIRLFAFPPEAERFKKERPHMILGFGQHSTVLRAQDVGADFMQLYPDVIYADGCYATVARHLTRSSLSLFADNLNAYDEPVLDALSGHVSADGALIAKPLQLLDAVSGNLSRRSLDQIYRTDDAEGPDAPVKTIFQLPDGLAMHSLITNPVYVSHAALMRTPIKNFTVTDDLFAGILLHTSKSEELRFLTSPEYLCVELCKDDGILFQFTSGTLARRIRNFFVHSGCSAIRKTVFEQRNFFANVRSDDHQTLSLETADAILSEILTMFETDGALSDLQRERLGAD